MRRPARVVYAVALLLFCLIPISTLPQGHAAEVIPIDVKAAARPFPHFWEQMFGSGRAILSLRESYRRDLREVKRRPDFEYVRFHAIFHDEVGLYDEDATGNPVYNFSYVDQIYDGLLANGVRPFVELSFMPKKLAAENTLHAFWYKPNVSPPKDYGRWGDLIHQFAQHLVDRYGIDEVSQWYFEVWNEPNIDFWTGVPKEQTYYQLYDAAARALKSVSPRLRVGGPATAQAAWVDRFIRHAVAKQRPRGLRIHARLRQRQIGRRLRHEGSDSPHADGLPRRGEGARSNQSVRAAGPALDLERVQRQLHERAGCDGHGVHGSVAGRHDSPMRWLGRHDELLDVFGCL